MLKIVEHKFSPMLRRVSETAPNTGNWKERHIAAIESPKNNEFGVVEMLKGWLAYADMHFERYESLIGDDGVLGQEWEAIGDALLGLLNGETGRLDCGTLDGIIRDVMRLNNVDMSER